MENYSRLFVYASLGSVIRLTRKKTESQPTVSQQLDKRPKTRKGKTQRCRDSNRDGGKSRFLSKQSTHLFRINKVVRRVEQQHQQQQPSDGRRKTKEIVDNVHGFLFVSSTFLPAQIFFLFSFFFFLSRRTL
jgi:hypothetical protein